MSETNSEKPQWSSSINLNSRNRRPSSAIGNSSNCSSNFKGDVDEARRPSTSTTLTIPSNALFHDASVSRPDDSANGKSPLRLDDHRSTSAMASTLPSTVKAPSSRGLTVSNAPKIGSVSLGRTINNDGNRLLDGPMGAHWDVMLQASHIGSVGFSADSAAAVAKVRVKTPTTTGTWGRENQGFRGGIYGIA